MVSLRTASRRPSHLANLIELIPRSDKARLIDFVKLRGVVDGSRRSNHLKESDFRFGHGEDFAIFATQRSGLNLTAGLPLVSNDV